MFDHVIVPFKAVAVYDGREEVSTVIVIHHEINVVPFFNDMVELGDVGMMNQGFVHCDFSCLEFCVLRVVLEFGHAFDSKYSWIELGCREVMGEVYDSVCTRASPANKPESDVLRV